MPFTRADAIALHQRLSLGWSVCDEDGNEVQQPPARRKPAMGPVPSVDDLLARFRDAVEAGAPKSLRLPSAAGAVPVALDLAPFAARAGVTVADALARSEEAPPAIPWSPAHDALYGSRVPERFRSVIVEGTVRETRPMVDVRAWIAGGMWGVVLAGNRGVGKSVAACVGLVLAGGGLFVTTEEIAAPSGRDLADDAASAAFLVLDDMGDEALTDLATVRIRTIIGTRHKGRRRTVCTTNLALAAWSDRYGSRLVDWLREGDGFRVYAGDSLRGRP